MTNYQYTLKNNYFLVFLFVHLINNYLTRAKVSYMLRHSPILSQRLVNQQYTSLNTVYSNHLILNKFKITGTSLSLTPQHNVSTTIFNSCRYIFKPISPLGLLLIILLTSYYVQCYKVN